VDVTKINLDSSHAHGSGSAPTFSFFDSPLGMLMAVIFTMVGMLALYLLLKAAAPIQDDSDRRPGGDSIVNAAGGPIDEKELMRELQKGRRGAVNPAEALHVTIYQTAAGQPANNLVPADFAAASTGTATAASEAAPNATGAMVTVPVTPTTTSPPVNGNGGGDNAAQLQVTLPPVSSLSANPNAWVKMPVPQVAAPTVGSSDQSQPANGTAP
jgi:hypothetical protein